MHYYYYCYYYFQLTRETESLKNNWNLILTQARDVLFSLGWPWISPHLRRSGKLESQNPSEAISTAKKQCPSLHVTAFWLEVKETACSLHETAAKIQNLWTPKTTSKTQFLTYPAWGINFPQRHIPVHVLTVEAELGLLVLSLLQWGLYKFIPLLHWWDWCKQWGHDCSYLGPSRVSGESWPFSLGMQLHAFNLHLSYKAVCLHLKLCTTGSFIMDLTNLGQCTENLPSREQVQVHRHWFSLFSRWKAI